MVIGTSLWLDSVPIRRQQLRRNAGTVFNRILCGRTSTPMTGLLLSINNPIIDFYVDAIRHDFEFVAENLDLYNAKEITVGGLKSKKQESFSSSSKNHYNGCVSIYREPVELPVWDTNFQRLVYHTDHLDPLASGEDGNKCEPI
ncbi:hypothetical protein ANCDUO_09770 [Ancylostoma duodenale]|uniref:Uncharacterized protein n=1 Tax=Ancylostoma duodenale TaxID=51022 RepID=A0A0C2GFR9_9BILA|nr:hypothetical protein ANCDUO_09770 [Ancylostoma duodenale]